MGSTYNRIKFKSFKTNEKNILRSVECVGMLKELLLKYSTIADTNTERGVWGSAGVFSCPASVAGMGSKRHQIRLGEAGTAGSSRPKLM